MDEIELDALDRAILGALLEDGRQSQVELAERIPLSATAIARRIRALEEKGVTFERYEGLGQDEKGVARQYPPPIAWFKDPAGNIVSLIQL